LIPCCDNHLRCLYRRADTQTVREFPPNRRKLIVPNGDSLYVINCKFQRPIGLWIFSIVSDLIFKFGYGGPVWDDVAFYTLAGGIVGALIAALPGFIDLTDLENPKTKKIAIWHMIINLVAVALYCVNFWLRMHRAPGDNLPIVLSVIGIVLIIISGWLGGEMVYVRGVAVQQPPDQSI